MYGGVGSMIEIPAIEITKDGTGENDGEGDDDECDYSIVEMPSSVGRRRSSATHSQQHQQQVRCNSPHTTTHTKYTLYTIYSMKPERKARNTTPRNCNKNKISYTHTHTQP